METNRIDDQLNSLCDYLPVYFVQEGDSNSNKTTPEIYKNSIEICTNENVDDLIQNNENKIEEGLKNKDAISEELKKIPCFKNNSSFLTHTHVQSLLNKNQIPKLRFRSPPSFKKQDFSVFYHSPEIVSNFFKKHQNNQIKIIEKHQNNRVDMENYNYNFFYSNNSLPSPFGDYQSDVGDSTDFKINLFFQTEENGENSLRNEETNSNYRKRKYGDIFDSQTREVVKNTNESTPPASLIKFKKRPKSKVEIGKETITLREDHLLEIQNYVDQQRKIDENLSISNIVKSEEFNKLFPNSIHSRIIGLFLNKTLKLSSPYPKNLKNSDRNGIYREIEDFLKRKWAVSKDKKNLTNLVCHEEFQKRFPFPKYKEISSLIIEGKIEHPAENAKKKLHTFVSDLLNTNTPGFNN